MSARIIDVLDWISERWVALTPPDQVEYAYHELDSDEVQDGELAHRGFMFDYPQRGEPLGLHDDVASQVPWSVEVAILLSKSGLDRRPRVDAVTNEVNLLMRSLETAGEAEYPVGLLELSSGGVLTIEADESGDVVATMQIRATCAEVD